MKKPSKELLFMILFQLLILSLIILRESVQIIQLQVIAMGLLIWVFYLAYRLELKNKSEAENAKKLELLKDCEQYLPTLSTILQQLLKTDNSATKKELVSLLVKNINEDNLDFLMLYINQAKLYEAVEKHCEACLKKLDPNEITFEAEKTRLEEALQGVRFKSSRLFDHLFGKPA